MRDYHVIFWRQPVVPDADRLDGVTQEQVVWAASEYDLREAADVHEVIAWAHDEAHRRRATYTLYAVIRTGDREGQVWIAGVNPTAGPATNFERRQPPDVDPVWGGPSDAYGSK